MSKKRFKKIASYKMAYIWQSYSRNSQSRIKEAWKEPKFLN